MKKYLELCNIHISAMEALSGIELTGIKELDVQITVKRANSKETIKLSVRDMLMEYQTEAGKWVL